MLVFIIKIYSDVEALFAVQYFANCLYCLHSPSLFINEFSGIKSSLAIHNFLFSHLWDFVSKFTEYDAKKLYKLYKHAVKKAKPEKDVEEKVSYLQLIILK